MRKIRLVCVGKLKEKWLKEAQDEYIKRLSRFCRVEVIELPDLPTPDAPTAAEAESVMSREGERIKKAVAGFFTVIALAIEGEEHSSESFAEVIRKKLDMGDICFIIGGSLGIAADIKRSADALVALSRLTMPHRLARVVFLEQLFRACKINAGESYHK